MTKLTLFITILKILNINMYAYAERDVRQAKYKNAASRIPARGVFLFSSLRSNLKRMDSALTPGMADRRTPLLFGSSGSSDHEHYIAKGSRARAQAVQSRGKLQLPSCQGGVARRDGVVIPQNSDWLTCLQIEENPLPPAEYSPLAGGEFEGSKISHATSLPNAKHFRSSMGGD
jgi:hypothetical protein